ncbi:MAG: hypothetical protein OEX10_09325 [Candidatus Bathyarchaeota archaeon]|nr:hypothetical protein [Candidatus Bathyarchaeota archaeon]MDH5663713.1 hypothetical protein [Candidatus Bathyarchaeota archaeon]
MFIMVSSAVKNSVVHHFRGHELEKHETSRLAAAMPFHEKRVKDLAPEDFGELCK